MEAFIGLTVLFAGNFAPKGWAFCDGQLVDITQRTALYAILGTQYGGDGQSTFALPNLNAALPETGAPKYIICMDGIFPTRD